MHSGMKNIRFLVKNLLHELLGTISLSKIRRKKKYCEFASAGEGDFVKL